MSVVTAPVHATMRRPLPSIFDRLVVFLAVQAHVLAAISIIGNPAAYRSVLLCWGLFLISLATPLTCVVVARRTGGGLSARAFLTAGVVLLLVDVGVTGISPGVDAGAPASWTWGTLGVTILTFAAFRPAKEILLLAAAHSMVAVATLIYQAGNPNVDAFRVVLVLNDTALPALVAAQYLGLYVHAVGLREDATAARLAIETRIAAQRAVEADAERRLGALRTEVVPLLTSVAMNTEATINDPAVAALARRLARDLRRQLVESRSGQWLIETSGQDKDDGWPGVVLLDPQGLLPRLDNRDRAALLGLLDMLRTYAGWQRVSVGLSLAGGAVPVVGEHHVVARDNVPAALTVVAIGPAAKSSLIDPRIVAAAARLGALPSNESPTLLLVEATVALRPEADLAEDLHDSST